MTLIWVNDEVGGEIDGLVFVIVGVEDEVVVVVRVEVVVKPYL